MISKSHRFHGLGSLRPVYRFGKSVRGGQIGLRYRPNHRLKTYRAAVVVSKKVHKSAVKRNLVRRRVYEVIRLKGEDINQTQEFVITVFSDQVIDWPVSKLEKEITRLLKAANIINH